MVQKWWLYAMSVVTLTFAMSTKAEHQLGEEWLSFISKDVPYQVDFSAGWEVVSDKGVSIFVEQQLKAARRELKEWQIAEAVDIVLRRDAEFNSFDKDKDGHLSEKETKALAKQRKLLKKMDADFLKNDPERSQQIKTDKEALREKPENELPHLPTAVSDGFSSVV